MIEMFFSAMMAVTGAVVLYKLALAKAIQAQQGCFGEEAELARLQERLANQAKGLTA
jgi:hypothetical protein